MTSIRRVLSDRRARQRGSVLSGLLIIVAMLAILVGALMTDLSSSFVLSRTVGERVQREATVSSAMELGFYELQASAVPHVCATDPRGPWFVSSLNGSPAAVTQRCAAIVPDTTASIGGGAYTLAGNHETAAGHNSYLVASAGGALSSYAFGTTVREWSVALGGAPTASLSPLQDPARPTHVSILVPDNAARLTCLSHCVSLYDQGLGAPAFRCDMASAAAVGSQPAAGAHFPGYALFGDSGGTMYVYDASSDGSCRPVAILAGLGGPVVGQPIVLPGTTVSRAHLTTVVDDIFVVTSTATTTQLAHWQLSQMTDDRIGIPVYLLLPIATVPVAVGGSAVESNPSSLVPVDRGVIRFAVAGRTGRVALGRITATLTRTGFTYAMSASATVQLAGQLTHDPYWCHCPGGDLIGVGGANGFLYLLDTSLNIVRQYDGVADGRPAINSTPVADGAGDWYFGADDGFVYDVEIPASGLQMFKAARFGPGGALRSSPVAGSCGPATCVYVASTTSGPYFAKLANTRLIELRACVTTAAASTTCAADPRLWARVMVGPPSVVGGRGISIQGWSYYSP